MSIYVDDMLFGRLLFIFTWVYLLFLYIFILCVILIELLMVLFVDCFHLIKALASAWTKVWLLATFTNFVFKTYWSHTLMARCTEWSSLFLNFGWTRICTISIWSSKLRLTLSASKKTFFTFSGLVLTYSFHASILIIIRCNFNGIALSTYGMQEVWIFTISVTITLDHVSILLLSGVFLLPSFHAVCTLSILKFIKQNFVLINDFSKRSYSVGSIQWIIRIKTFWFFWLLFWGCWSEVSSWSQCLRIVSF